MMRIARSFGPLCILGAMRRLSAPKATQQAGDASPGVVVHPGYVLEPVVTGLDFPTAIAFGPDRL